MLVKVHPFIFREDVQSDSIDFVAPFRVIADFLRTNSRKGLPRSNDTVRIRPFTVTLRRINGPYTAVQPHAVIRPYHNEITARIRPYTVKIRPRIRCRITACGCTV